MRALPVLLIALVLAACDLARPAVEIRSYMPPPPAPQTRQALDARAGRFDVDTAYSGKPLIWRLSDTRYESDFYNELLSSPRAMLLDRTERWFALRNTSEQVGLAPPRYVLEAHVDELYGDMRTRPGHAVLQVRYVLSTSGAEPKIVFERTYSERAPMSGTTPESLVTAYGVAIDRVLARLQQDVANLR